MGAMCPLHTANAFRNSGQNIAAGYIRSGEIKIFNSLCMLFANDARRQLHIFLYNLVTIFKSHANYAILFFAKFFDKS